MAVERDKVDIGLNRDSQEKVEAIMAKGWFSEAQDLARFALSYAVRAGVPIGTTTGAQTRWSSGNFDPSGEIRAVVMAMYPKCATPIRQMEFLVNEGISLIHARVVDGGAGPPDLLS